MTEQHAITERDQELVRRAGAARHLARSGGRLACPHPVHRFARVPNSPAEIILPECAGQEAWLAARRGGIGGSEVGALVGVNEYETTFSVWTTKMEGGKDLSDKAAVDWGHRLEEAVAQKAADELGLVHRFAGGLWARRDNPILRVTPDRLVCKPRSWNAIGLIECKTAGDDEHWQSGTIHPGGHGTGSAPLGYQAQVQWQLGILGLKVGWLACFHLSNERQFFMVEIHFDPEWFGELVDAAERFWHVNILGDEIPMHDLRHPITEDLLKKLSPSVVRPSVELGEDADMWLSEYEAARDKFKQAETDFNSIKNYFRMMTGDAGAGYIGDHKAVGYPEVTTSRIDVELLRERYPEIAEELTVKSHHRRLTVYPRKKGNGGKTPQS